MQILRTNMQKQTWQKEAVPEDRARLGGRGLIAKILLDEVPPACDALGPFNKLIFATGLLAGCRLSSCDRLSAGGKSPLTGGVKESNAGGSTAQRMVDLGLKAIIIEGQPDSSSLWVLHLNSAGAAFVPASELAGKGVYETAELLRKTYGKKAAMSIIGPAGEMLLQSAGISNLDKDGRPSRINARGGLGALMGSKRLKAVVFDPAGTDSQTLSDVDGFKQIQKHYTRVTADHPQTKVYAEYGTQAMTSYCNSVGALPTRGFSSGNFDLVDDISGDSFHDLLLVRGKPSNTTHACMAGCIIRSSNILGDENGCEIVAPLEYETIGLIGSNLGLNNFDDIGKINHAANDIGVDTIELGAALGVAAEAGLMVFGDGKRSLELVEEIRDGSALGRVIGSGAGMTGKVFGIRRVPVVKNQAISAYDPRAIKGTGVTFATSPQGADHTCGNTIRAKVDHLKPEKQVETSRASQFNMAGYDTLGACMFTTFGLGANPDIVPELINKIYGWNVGVGYLQELGRETIRMEREFNRAAGFTEKDDRIPEWMTEEPLPPHGTVFDVPHEELDHIFDQVG